MHSVIKEIIRSTEKRILQLKKENNPEKKETMREEKRDIIIAIKEKRLQKKVAVIAEVKPASPGKKLMDIMPNDAARIATEMERAGAVAVSVLTEPEFFHGSLNNLVSVVRNVSIPVLRKDFIINELQLDETRSNLILLIAGILGEELEHMVNLALSKGFEPLVEIHDRIELERALRTKAKLIGINNRDLSTLEIDLDTTLKLAPLIKEFDLANNSEHIIISESGIHSTQDIKKVMVAGADAVLVGTSIIKDGDVYAKTKQLVDAFDEFDMN
ncbi:indole-3-glycerol-phosphate synthase [Methanolobus sp. WCC5]|uniref:indole-3-glycerol-phosphate synthase n=1 Tax=Methanolobus sp. WCC5 TaxID=3125785 RepID=UPI00324477DB